MNNHFDRGKHIRVIWASGQGENKNNNMEWQKGIAKTSGLLCAEDEALDDQLLVFAPSSRSEVSLTNSIGDVWCLKICVVLDA